MCVVYFVADRGSHWETIVPKLPGRDVLSTYRQALLRTTDGGRTWSEIRLPRHSKASVSPA